MKITDAAFSTDMADTFETAITEALKKQSDTFSFAYSGGDGTPAGVTEEMKCLVILMPAPLADLMAEGLPAVRVSLGTLAAELGAKAAEVKAGDVRPV